ncbi:MAG: GMC family oxidoreductase N-terminal domain-containing protein [Comamonadaceae bacterium]|nr:GMC family oxidoreductase N-terminal domain-containing protein [Comamonadaceae bacterium]
MTCSGSAPKPLRWPGAHTRAGDACGLRLRDRRWRLRGPCVRAARLLRGPGGAGRRWSRRATTTRAASSNQRPDRARRCTSSVANPLQLGLRDRAAGRPRRPRAATSRAGEALGGSSADQRDDLHSAASRRTTTAGPADGSAGLGLAGRAARCSSRAEHNERGADAFHGTGGPLNVDGSALAPIPLGARLRRGGAAGRHRRTNPDFNGAEQEGVGPYQVTQKNGERWSAARAYPRAGALARPNLAVFTERAGDARRAGGQRARVGIECRAGSAARAAVRAREVTPGGRARCSRRSCSLALGRRSRRRAPAEPWASRCWPTCRVGRQPAGPRRTSSSTVAAAALTTCSA